MLAEEEPGPGHRSGCAAVSFAGKADGALESAVIQPFSLKAGMQDECLYPAH
jgi:hypothetical protein